MTAETRVAPGARIELGDVILWLEAHPDEGVALEPEEAEEAPRGHTIVHEMTALVPALQPVVAAEPLPRRRDFTVLGDVVNTAARIKATVARPGEILLADATWNQLGGRLPGACVGPVSLRGRRAQVDVYRLADGE